MAKSKGKFNLDRVPSFMKNKYFIILTLFFAWMLFFDRNDIISQFQLKHQLSQLKKEKTYYQEKIDEVDRTTKDLSNPDRLEQFAREEYLMKKDNEDVFVIVEEKAKK